MAGVEFNSQSGSVHSYQTQGTTGPTRTEGGTGPGGPNRKDTFGSIGGDNSGDDPTQLPPPNTGGTVDVTSILLAFHQLAQTMKAGEKLARQSSRDSEISALDRQIDSIKRQAVFSLTQGIVGGLSQIAAAGAMAKGATKSLNAGREITTLQNKASNLLEMQNPKSPVIQRELASVRTEHQQKFGGMSADAYVNNVLSPRANAWSSVLKAGGDIFGGGLGFGAKMEEANQTSAQKEQKRAGFQTQDHDEYYQKFNEMMDSTRQMLRDIQNAQNDVANRIVRA